MKHPGAKPDPGRKGTFGQKGDIRAEALTSLRTAVIHLPLPQNCERVLPAKAAPIAGLFNRGKRARAEPGSPRHTVPGAAGARRG